MKLINKIGLCLLALSVSTVPLLKLNSELLPFFWSKNIFTYSGIILAITLVIHLQIDEKTRKFEVKWIYPKGLRTNLVGEISNLDQNNRMTLIGSMGEDRIQIELQKEEVKSIWKTY